MFKYIFFALLVFTQMGLFAVVSQGETLERKIWEDTKDHKWDDLANKIASEKANKE